MSNYDDFITGFVPALQFLSAASASSDASIDFTGIDNSYDEYEVHLLNVIPVSDGANFQVRTSTDGGSTYDSGATDYAYGNLYTSGTTPTASGATSASAIRLVGGVGSSVDEEGVSGVVRIIRPSEVQHTDIAFEGMYTDILIRSTPIISGGKRKAVADVDAIQFLFSAGNVESGLFALYGVNRV